MCVSQPTSSCPCSSLREALPVGLVQICRASVQEPGGPIEKLQHPVAPDARGRVRRRLRLSGQRRNPPPLGLRYDLLPGGAEVELRRAGGEFRPLRVRLQQAMRGLAVQRYVCQFENENPARIHTNIFKITYIKSFNPSRFLQ